MERAIDALVGIESRATDTARAARTLHVCLSIDPDYIDSPAVRRQIALLELDEKAERQNIVLIVVALTKRGPWWLPKFLWRFYG
jgi:hypothetical protein